MNAFLEREKNCLSRCRTTYYYYWRPLEQLLYQTPLRFKIKIYPETCVRTLSLLKLGCTGSGDKTKEYFLQIYQEVQQALSPSNIQSRFEATGPSSSKQSPLKDPISQRYHYHLLHSNQSFGVGRHQPIYMNLRCRRRQSILRVIISIYSG